MPSRPTGKSWPVFGETTGVTPGLVPCSTRLSFLLSMSYRAVAVAPATLFV